MDISAVREWTSLVADVAQVSLLVYLIIRSGRRFDRVIMLLRRIARRDARDDTA